MEEVDIKKEVTVEEVEEAKKHIQVLANFAEGQEIGFNSDGTTRVITEEEKKEESSTKFSDNVEKVLKKELRDSDNNFDSIFVKGYSARFAQVMNASIVDRFWLMSSVVSYANQDKELNDYQRNIIKDIDEAFADACCIDGPSKRLMRIINKKPNLMKMIKPVRIERTYDTIMLSPSRLGFHSVPTGNFVPLFFTSFAMSYGWNKIHLDLAYAQNHKFRNITGNLLAALLAKFANGISPYDYANMWFVLMFIKNLSVCSITKQEVIDQNPEIKVYGDHLLELVDHMLEICAPNLFETDTTQVDKDKNLYNTQSDIDDNDNVVEI